MIVTSVQIKTAKTQKHHAERNEAYHEKYKIDETLYTQNRLVSL